MNRKWLNKNSNSPENQDMRVPNLQDRPASVDLETKYFRMKKGMLKVITSLRQDKSPIEASLSTLILPALITKMKHKLNWASEKLYALIQLKSRDKQIEPSGWLISKEIESFQITEGKLKESFFLEKVDSETTQKNIKYSLLTREETMFLLSIRTSNLQPVEN